MKKTIGAALALTLLGSVALSACSSKEQSTPQGTVAPDTGKVTPAGSFPITNDKTTLKVMVKQNALVEDFATNEFTKWLEQKTNIHIDWDVVPASSAQDKLNIVLASSDYPDVIMDFNVSATQQMINGAQGIFLPLNGYIDKYGVEFKKVLQENDYLKGIITAPDGNIYSLPQVNQCYHCSMPQKMWVYKPWLDKLGLKLPTTTDEFEQMLKAFKEKDPNGNGKADEIPLAGSRPGAGANTQIDQYLMNAFIYNDTSAKRLSIVGGKVTPAYNQAGWRDGLRYLHKLYAGGLIAPQTFTQDDKQLKQMGENPNVPILGASSAQHMGIFTDTSAKGTRWSDYVAVPPLKGPGGLQVTPLNPWGISPGNFIITNKAKNPEAAFRMADALFNREFTMNSVFGRENQEWRWAKSGELGMDGKPAIWARLQNFGTIQNVFWAQTGPSYRPAALRAGEATDPAVKSLNAVLQQETQTDYEPYKQKQDALLPPLFFTNEQVTELADMEKSIVDYVEQMLARFVIGDADLDKDWDTYVKTLESKGLTRYLQIYQQAYDASFKKK
ncbi:MAG: ABC transporter substrate-binding protein [Paenibacillaceae bacterium]|nr:ABC transporter substrate-binding protein [Paenibacillaceae bacterium]